jgi:DNA-binding NtrC family response regulator
MEAVRKSGMAKRKQQFIYQSPAMVDLMAEVQAFADCEQTILLLGETGVGKERVAEQIHLLNQTHGRGPFVPVNCGAIPDNLFESLFFGHLKGSFSGAHQSHKGYFEQANGGTLFLDELGEMPLAQQVKLLRVLESREVTPIGSEASQPTHFRLVVATNRDLRQLIKANQFRADLFYRVAVIEIYVPNLQERGLPDRLALFRTFVYETIGSHGNPSTMALPEWLLDLVCALQLPGNVRQLRNLAERVGVIVRRTGIWDRPLIERAVTVAVASESLAPSRLISRVHLDASKSRDERQRIIDALSRNAWVRGNTASELGISRKTLWERMRNLEIIDRRAQPPLVPKK